MINQYKRIDVFKCTHLSHKRFGNRVSVYHVLKVKKCYQNGCISFEGICRLINKGQRCIKGYNFVGVNCSSCVYFKEEKIMRKPVVLLNNESYKEFIDELEEFEDWIEYNKGRKINFRGEVSWVKPKFEKRIYKKYENLSLNGFIMGFKIGFIDTQKFDDYSYALISVNNQERWSFSRGYEIEFNANLNIDNGMIMFEKIRDIEIISDSSKQSHPTKSEAEVASKIGKILPEKSEKCVNCPSVSLIYIKDFTHSEP
ncbi:MAG: hypothetical protein HWN67_11005, partial [Candidatus Helarchaeota archaeon]|nr:hypothetical protein [Candidatus Helarchaeota archaeon]